MEILLILLIIMIAHWIADFILQTTEVAINKGKHMWALLQHTGHYSLAMLFFCIPLTIFGVPDEKYLLFIMINGILHGLVDYFTSRLRNKVYNEEDNHMFFVLVGFDQLLHLSILFTTAHYMLNLF